MSVIVADAELSDYALCSGGIVECLSLQGLRLCMIFHFW